MLDWLKNVHRRGNPNPPETFEASRQDNLHTELGEEIPDGTPLQPPVGYQKQPSMVEHIRNMVRSEMLKQHVQAQGFETFEESEDFDTGDDYDALPLTAYEAVFEPPTPAPEAAPPPDGPPATPPPAPPGGSPQGGPGATGAPSEVPSPSATPTSAPKPAS